VAILPLALMSGIALQALLEQQRAQTEQSSLDLARALATAVDTELRLTISALQSLALTEPLASAPSRPRQRARSARASSPRGRMARRAARHAGGAALQHRDADRRRRRRRSPSRQHRGGGARRAPVVGPLTRGPLGNFGIPVRVPVESDGELRYVLSAVVRPEAILRVVSEQRVPGDWIVSVFDSNNSRIARSRDHQRFLGTPPSPSLQELMASLGARSEAVGASSTVEGTPVYTALARVSSAQWVVALGVPAAVEASAVRDSALAYGGGILLSLGLGSVAAWLLSGSIAAPIARLRDAAAALGRGAPVKDAQAGLIEIEAVSQALVAAAAQRTRARPSEICCSTPSARHGRPPSTRRRACSSSSAPARCSRARSRRRRRWRRSPR
jgi:hypothetical protein